MNEKKKRMDVWIIISLVILALYGLFLIYPLIRLLIESVSKEGKFTLEYFGKFYKDGGRAFAPLAVNPKYYDTVEN